MLKFNSTTREVVSKLLLLAAFLVLGLLIASQYLLYQKMGFTQSSNDPGGKAVRVSNLYSDNNKLKDQLNDRETQLNNLQDAASNNDELQKLLDEDKAKYQIILGVVPVNGPGVTIDINHQLVLTQLVDLINALRNSGSEAIAVNGKRVITTTPMESFVDQANYKIEVIGEKDVLYESVTRPGGILDLITYGSATRSDNLLLPKV
ncbi:MAG: DUF881 domain-containing protein [Candidatus Berkelbacteria bacterium]|nr:DUF881 domain-containing protein [Candidatus Berkelbacteria bacterium]